jgi:hypothetical protein
LGTCKHHQSISKLHIPYNIQGSKIHSGTNHLLKKYLNFTSHRAQKSSGTNHLLKNDLNFTIHRAQKSTVAQTVFKKIIYNFIFLMAGTFIVHH